MSTSKNSKAAKATAAERRARVAAQREAAKRAEARRTLIRRISIGAGVLVLAGGVVTGAILIHNASGGTTSSTAKGNGIKSVPATPLTAVKGAATSPPWAAPANASARAKAAGLPMLGTEGQVLHIHAHLDIIVDGKAVTVPGNIGIDETQQQLSPLHTHDTTGVIHIESPTKADFTLGQVMTEWDVALTDKGIGGLKTGGGNQLHVYVDGKEQTGNPGAIKLAAHEEIAIVYGKDTSKVKVPSSYTFAQGE
ncbi:MAG: hypothetical protein QOF44_3483 [Streptomyces sp.]|nr:hypothetical protein [Streptomyces sp.]